MAIGSTSELEYQIILARDLQYLDEKVDEGLMDELGEVRRMIYSFRQKLKTDVQ